LVPHFKVTMLTGSDDSFCFVFMLDDWENVNFESLIFYQNDIANSELSKM